MSSDRQDEFRAFRQPGPFVWAIRHKRSGKVYVCFTLTKTAGLARARHQEFLLRRGLHHARDLQADWTAFGEDAFAFIVLERPYFRSLAYHLAQSWVNVAAKHGRLYNPRQKVHRPAALSLRTA